MDVFEPVQWLADWVSFGLLGLGRETYWGETANFFVYDMVKIGILLVAINFLMAIVRHHFPVEKVRDLLAARKWHGLEYLFAALLGVITPFCSCSSIPLFIGFVGAGIPLGVTFAFLIASPLINESSLYLFPAIFGIETTLIYNLLGISVAVAGGMLIRKLNLERYVRRELLEVKVRTGNRKEGRKPPLRKLAAQWWREGWEISRQIFPYLAAGVGLGALIHGFVPASFAEQYLSSKEWWAVPTAVLLGAPLYANSVGVIPIMQALVEKGVPIGTALAFMTAIVTVSIPEMMILRKVMRWQLLAAFLGIAILGIVLMGYALNALL